MFAPTAPVRQWLGVHVWCCWRRAGIRPGDVITRVGDLVAPAPAEIGPYVAQHAHEEPPQLFGMMNAEFAALRGFPLIDHAELPYGKSKLIVDNSVVRIEQKNVALSLINVRSEYKEITTPGASRPPASSPPPGQSTPATE